MQKGHKRILITGASGFVGANLARRLLRDGHEVHLLLRPGHKRWRLVELMPAVTSHEVQLTDRRALDRLIRQVKPQWIFHLATYGAYPHQTNLETMVATNVLGTLHLVESALAAGFEAFVNAGSSSEYGCQNKPPSERDRIEPNSAYAVTKAAATLYCRQAARRTQAHLLTLRLYSAYGPYEEPTRLIPTLIRKGLNNQLPPLVSPDIARDFIYIDDVVDAFVMAAQRQNLEPGAVYNAGTGRQLTIRDVVRIARRVMHITTKARWTSMPDRAWDTTAWVADNRQMRKCLGWTPRIDFETGFSRTFAWFKNHPRHTRFAPP